MIDTLCISGGGSTGVCFVGSVSYLENQEWFNLDNINTFVGTSSGSLIIFLFVIGYKSSEIIDFFYKFNLNKIEPNASCINFFNYLGLDEGEKLLEVAKTFLYEKYKTRNVTFQELFNLTGKKIRIIATNYTKSSVEIFDYESHPDLSVLLAMRMSYSVPFLFTPVLYNDCYYIDGALLMNFGIEYCNPETTIGISSHCVSENKMDSIFSYINGLCQLFLTSASRNISKEKYNIIEIQTAIDDSLDFGFDENRVSTLINKGKDLTKNFLYKFESKIILNEIIDKIADN
tara:strand:- start:924 stop:1787 length:864 start_codon:yes stop_codon:yes gene_type:complete